MQTSAQWSPPASLDAVEGWFYPRDQAVMTWLLDRQERLEPGGDLLELGSYLGKSAIVIGTHLRAGETFTICDLFDTATEEAADSGNVSENKWSYSSLTRKAFEANYLTFHETLPTIVQATTDQITDHLKPDSCRFVHIDASHLFQHVTGDLAAARSLLRPDGLVVCDDYRSEHTPGVAAAVWTAVANEGLRPICITGNKFYGTWGDPAEVQDEMFTWLSGFHRHLPERQQILGHTVLRVCRWGEPPLPDIRPLHPAPAVEEEPPAPKPVVPKSRARAIAKDLLPPVVTRALRKYR